MAAGWGMINITTKKKDSFLQKVNLTIYPLQDCINKYKVIQKKIQFDGLENKGGSKSF